MINVLSYAIAMWTTLVVPCVTVPENWKACTSDLDVWLYPELVRGFILVTGREKAYQSERDILER